jgi:hypothetical protein
MPRKMLEVPPAAARAFVKDMKAFHAAATGLERDEITARAASCATGTHRAA